MTGFLLIRHASAAHLGRHLAGRSAGLHLNEAGRAQARALAQELAGAPLAAIRTSPLERAQETARPIADALGLEPVISSAFQEVDFGEWTGASFDELDGDPLWQTWNESRGSARVPGGESMSEVLERALDGLTELAGEYEGGWVAIVSHLDVIRPLLAHYAGMPLDHLLRLEVSPASVSALRLHAWGADILGINCFAARPWSPDAG